MIAMLLSLPGYLLYTVCLVALPYMVFRGAMSAFSVVDKEDEQVLASITISLSLALKNLPWFALISEFPSTLPSSFSEMIAALVGLAGYLVIMTGLSFLLLIVAIFARAIALRTHPDRLPDRLVMINFGVAVVVMDVFMNHSSHSSMMAILLFLAGYLVNTMCLTGLPYMVHKAMTNAFPSFTKELEFIVVWIAIFLPLALNNFPLFTLISEFPSNFPSSVPEMIAALLGLAAYIVCMTGLATLVVATAIICCEAASRLHPEKEIPDELKFTITLGITVVVMNMFMKNSSHSKMMTTLLFAVNLVYILCVMGLSYLVFENLVFDDVTIDVLPFLLPIRLKYRMPAPIIVSGIILVVNDMHGVRLVEKPAFISEFLSTVPFSLCGTLPGFLIYAMSMMALSFLVLVIAVGAILQTWIRRPMGRPDLMLTTIVGLTFVLLNMMWGTPFEKPSSDSSMKETIVCLAGYLVYILCSVALSSRLCESMDDALVISVTFVLLHIFCVSDMMDMLARLVWMIAKALLTLIFLMPLLCLVSMGLYKWVSILLRSSGSSYKELTLASIICLFMKVMQTMLDTPALLGTADWVIRCLTIFSDMKATVLGVAESINNYQTAYTVISYLAAFVYIEITRNITANAH